MGNPGDGINGGSPRSVAESDQVSSVSGDTTKSNAITISEKDGTKGGLSVLTGIFSLGAQKTGEAINESITSIEFNIFD